MGHVSGTYAQCGMMLIIWWMHQRFDAYCTFLQSTQGAIAPMNSLVCVTERPICQLSWGQVWVTDIMRELSSAQNKGDSPIRCSKGQTQFKSFCVQKRECRDFLSCWRYVVWKAFGEDFLTVIAFHIGLMSIPLDALHCMLLWAYHCATLLCPRQFYIWVNLLPAWVKVFLQALSLYFLLFKPPPPPPGQYQ